jgi:hypothetical protein
VVEDDVRAAADRDRIVFLAGLVADPRAQVADDHVVGVDQELAVAQGDPVAGGGLAGDGDVIVGDLQVALQADHPADIEHHDARTLGLDGGAQRAGTGVVQIGHLDHATAATALGELAEAFGAWKSGQVGWGRREGG